LQYPKIYGSHYFKEGRLIPNTAKKPAAIIIIMLLVYAAAGFTLYNYFIKGKKPENVTLNDLTGNSHTIAFETKPTVLLFFTTWCPYCNEDAPKVVTLYERYQADINLYGINVIDRDDRQEVEEYVKKHGIQYPVLLDEGSYLHKEYGSPGFPTLVFLNKNGREIRRIIGSTSIEMIEAHIKNAIGN
jgi:thiol-disulfide isomerase/thioredoxin